jgi:hypothetical protein
VNLETLPAVWSLQGINSKQGLFIAKTQMVIEVCLVFFIVSCLAR